MGESAFHGVFDSCGWCPQLPAGWHSRMSNGCFYAAPGSRDTEDGSEAALRRQERGAFCALWGTHGNAQPNGNRNFVPKRHQRLPGLRSHFTGLTTLHNMDEDFGFEDVLDLPDLRESMPASLHDVMEAKLRL